MNDKDLMKKLSMMTNEEIEQEAHVKNSPERKRQLMRLEKEKLVDMVFDLESRNEFLLHNLSEVEKMHNKLKEEIENG